MNNLMFAALNMRPKGVYKNVALNSNGGSITLVSGTVSQGAIENIIKGYRKVLSPGSNLDKLVQISAATPTVIKLDFGSIKNIAEINFCHGASAGFSQISEDLPNTNAWAVQGFSAITMEYSSNDSSYTTISSGYDTSYLFSQNILPSVITARYIKISFYYAVIISGIEAWGLN